MIFVVPGLQKISNLDECFNLLDLSLSHNEVRRYRTIVLSTHFQHPV